MDEVSGRQCRGKFWPGPRAFTPQGASRGEGPGRLGPWADNVRKENPLAIRPSSPRHTLGAPILRNRRALDKQAYPLRNHTTELEKSHHAPCQPWLLSPDILPTFPESIAFHPCLEMPVDPSTSPLTFSLISGRVYSRRQRRIDAIDFTCAMNIAK